MIEVGEYVRTRAGHICKITNIDENGLIYWNKIQCGWSKQQLEDFIIKHSKQLIDLIEKDDYVNGYKILAMESSIYKNSKRILIYKNERENYERWIYIQEHDGRIHCQDDIVEILTKEQYMANCYKVGGENER